MKRIVVAGLLLASLGFVSFAAHAADAKKPEHAMGGKSQYLIISPHTDAECLATLDAVNKMGAASLSKWNFGCMDGDHTGYCTVMASSSEEALANVPESVRGKARAIKVHKFTAAELKAAHEHPHS